MPSPEIRTQMIKYRSAKDLQKAKIERENYLGSVVSHAPLRCLQVGYLHDCAGELPWLSLDTRRQDLLLLPPGVSALKPLSPEAQSFVPLSNTVGSWGLASVPWECRFKDCFPELTSGALYLFRVGFITK